MQHKDPTGRQPGKLTGKKPVSPTERVPGEPPRKENLGSQNESIKSSQGKQWGDHRGTQQGCPLEKKSSN